MELEHGKIVWSVVNTTEGELKFVKVIDEVYINTVKFLDGTTQMHSLLRQINNWIPVDEFTPDGHEVLCLNDRDDWCIGYYSSDHASCENEHELLEDVLYWMPKLETPKDA